MDYQTTFRSFINSHYLSEGIRITVGLTLPALAGYYLNQEAIGITMSLGASCLIMVDNAGPVHHRRNAMMVCLLVIFMVAMLTGFIAVSPTGTGILIAAFCFLFPMIGVYGARAGSIGLAALFIMVLNLEEPIQGWNVLFNALYIVCGGIWYMLLSLSLYSFRPFKVTQQALGDCIQSTAGYLLWRTAFYNKNPDFDQIYSQLLDKQLEIHEKQNLVRELLFKSRDIVKESTNTGRVILLIFLDIIDLFERVMSTQPDYKLLHRYFDQTDIFEKFRDLLLVISEELNETGIAVKSGKPYPMNDRMDIMRRELKKDFEQLRDEKRNASNVEGFIALRNVLDGLEDIISRLHTIQQYSSYDLRGNKREIGEVDYDRFVTHQDIDLKVLLDNFNWKSNTFRHALRVSLATTTGFIISQFFPVGHSYWILLTIIVILKPTYGLTKKRNYDRLLGTVAGAAIAALMLYFISDRQVIFGCMIFLMIFAYSFMRVKYLVFVTLMTPYILILFYLLNPHDFKNVVGDRLLDTVIGSAIAFLANVFIAPAWVKTQFTSYLVGMIEANKNYFRDVASSFIGEEVDVNQYKYSRKMAYVALANVTDALNRMLSEPKRKQKNSTEFHQFVVLSYMLASHTATLASYARSDAPVPADKGYQPVMDAVLINLSEAHDLLQQEAARSETEPTAIKENTLPVNSLQIQTTSPLPEGEAKGIRGKVLPGKDLGITGGSTPSSSGTAEPNKSTLPENNQPTAESTEEGKNPDQPDFHQPALEQEIARQAAAPENADQPTSEEGMRKPKGGVSAKEGLRIMNDRVTAMITKRKTELEQGILDSPTRQQLRLVKSVNDQFNFITKISEDLLKVVNKWRA